MVLVSIFLKSIIQLFKLFFTLSFKKNNYFLPFIIETEDIIDLYREITNKQKNHFEF